MADLISPHGGVSEPITRTVAALDTTAAAAMIPVSDADLSTLYRIADGGLSPLTGPMTKAEYDRVLDEEVIVRGGKKYAWTIPLAFPVTEEKAKKLQTGTVYPLTDDRGRVVGTIEVRDVYPWDKKKYNASVYATAARGSSRRPHRQQRPADVPRRRRGEGVPAAEEQGIRRPDPLAARDAGALRQERASSASSPSRRATPCTVHTSTRWSSASNGSRARGTSPGRCSTRSSARRSSDDVDAVTRMKTYRALIDNKALGQGDIDEELWKKVGRSFSDHVMLLGLDIKMFYAGPKEAVMHAIYRQNFGFTDIIIGRKHADAPFDDKGEIWDGLAAQRKFDELKGELKIKPVKVGFAAYYAELGRVGLVEEHAPKGWKPVNISRHGAPREAEEGRTPRPRRDAARDRASAGGEVQEPGVMGHNC